jgi:hypothetical protein
MVHVALQNLRCLDDPRRDYEIIRLQQVRLHSVVQDVRVDSGCGAGWAAALESGNKSAQTSRSIEVKKRRNES